MIKLAHSDLESHLPQTDATHLIVHYPGKGKFLLNYMDKLEKNAQLKFLYILSPDVRKLKDDFFSLFKIVKAAGGLVLNTSGQVLFIYRRGHWDLPKGKMESNETKKDAAVREVIEETGLGKVRIVKKLLTTYHIYLGQSSQKRILKPTYWYLMHTLDNKVNPQIEEDIEAVEWRHLTMESMLHLAPIYSNIKDVLREYLRMIQ